MVDILLVVSRSVDPHIFSDPDPGSQNYADPTYLLNWSSNKKVCCGHHHDNEWEKEREIDSSHQAVGTSSLQSINIIHVIIY